MGNAYITNEYGLGSGPAGEFASASKDVVTGIDLLIWSIVNAEFNNTNEQMVRIFEDFRDEISLNLKKLLYDYVDPSLVDLTD